METASIILASAAFFVAILSLYLGNLRRADITMIPVPTDRIYLGQHHQRRDEGPPIQAGVTIPLGIVNQGARPGLVTDLDVRRDSGPFYTIQSCHPTNPNWRDGIGGSLPLVSGESRLLVVEVSMTFSDESVHAWRDGRFRSFEVVLSYSFVKGRWFRPNVTKRIPVIVPVEQIVAST